MPEARVRGCVRGVEMKAWIVQYEDDWCSLVHEETRGKACAYIMNKVDPGDGFIHFRAIRLPGLDDKPITYGNACEAGFHYLDEYQKPLFPPEADEYFINDCSCEICKPKPAYAATVDVLR